MSVTLDMLNTRANKLREKLRKIDQPRKREATKLLLNAYQAVIDDISKEIENAPS